MPKQRLINIEKTVFYYEINNLLNLAIFVHIFKGVFSNAVIGFLNSFFESIFLEELGMFYSLKSPFVIKKFSNMIFI